VGDKAGPDSNLNKGGTNVNGGARVAEILKAQGVPFLFTLCGGHISPILVESKKRGIRVVDVRHEVNAVFAADAVGRLTGTPGVAAVTAGPGVTNTITAIKNAQMAQSPLVLLGGATATMLRGRGSLQDIDQMALIKPHVKWAARPSRLKDVIPDLEKAFEIAKSGVPGPVFVELAVDLLYEEATVREWYKNKTDKPNKKPMEHAQSLYIKGHLSYLFGGSANQVVQRAVPHAPVHASGESVSKAAAWVSSASKPVLVIGSQAMLHPNRVEELVAAVERLGFPVFLSGMARGLLGKGHPLQFKHKRGNALKESDLVILAGVPCDFRLDYGSPLSRTKVISVNLSKEDLNKNRRPDLGLLADPHSFLIDLSHLLPVRPPARETWLQTLKERNDARDTQIRAMANDQVEYVNPLELCMSLENHLSDNSVLVGDGGDFVATSSYVVNPRGPYSWLDPGVFGTLGVGAGFALGAKLVNPNADVWLLYGDGAAGFSMMEFDTFARHGVSVIGLIGNDAGWTQIARDQVVILEDDVGCTLSYMDYHKVAQGCGAEGLLLSKPSDVDSTLAQALEISRKGKPVLINALIGKTDFRKGSISM
jgi:acetolactate synthase-like protein